jgi:hypothetical protein
VADVERRRDRQLLIEGDQVDLGFDVLHKAVVVHLPLEDGYRADVERGLPLLKIEEGGVLSAQAPALTALGHQTPASSGGKPQTSPPENLISPANGCSIY